MNLIQRVMYWSKHGNMNPNVFRKVLSRWGLSVCQIGALSIAIRNGFPRKKNKHTFFSCIWFDDKLTSIFVIFSIMFCSISVDGISMAGEEGEHAWLEEREKPDDFVVTGAKYFGPKIVIQWFVVFVGFVGLGENECHLVFWS